MISGPLSKLCWIGLHGEQEKDRHEFLMGFCLTWFVANNALLSWVEDRKPSAYISCSSEFTKSLKDWSQFPRAVIGLPACPASHSSTLTTMVEPYVSCKENGQRKIKRMDSIHLLNVRRDGVSCLLMSGDISSRGEKNVNHMQQRQICSWLHSLWVSWWSCCAQKLVQYLPSP